MMYYKQHGLRFAQVVLTRGSLLSEIDKLLEPQQSLSVFVVSILWCCQGLEHEEDGGYLPARLFQKVMQWDWQAGHSF